ncbi:thioredoxin reductase [Parachaetomium inaequale]|uniref:Thioredoxin reductase n=1 Tax=Parachaetomium inaequale TaxID=2588326 RepID=A0AAN6PF03_9PEZI|nr:thioredoxin reductase [Parachaetomium inaequale]
MSDREGEQLADSLATALNAAGIPCVLWGHCLLSAHGVPTYTAAIDLVVPDAEFAAAREILATNCANFTQPLFACPDPTTCPKISPTRPHPPSAFHLHIQGATSHLVTSAVCLFLQSETLWFLPPFDASLASPRAHQLPRYLALASDRTALPPYRIGMGRGVFDNNQTVVLVPKSHILLEALMRIMARELGKRCGDQAVQTFSYIELYVDRDGFLDVDLLPLPFGKIYKNFKGGVVPVKDCLLKLRRAVGIAVEPNMYR